MDNFCINCNNKCKSLYCSNKCQGELKYKNSVNNWLSGNLQGWTGKTRKLKPFIIKYLKEVKGSSCSKCKWDEKHPIDNRSLTEINHIDGNAENCNIENLEILCPNCHSMTLNFKNRNVFSKRQRN